MNIPSAKRWARHLIGLLHVLLVIYLVVFIYSQGYREIINHQLYEFRIEYLLIMYLAGVLFSLVAERLGSFGPRHNIGTSLSTAPVWGAIFIISPIQFILMIWLFNVSIFSVLYSAALLISFFIGCGAKIAYRIFIYNFGVHEVSASKSFEINGFDENVLEWIASDGPVTSLKGDLFGFGERVKRVRGILDDHPGSNIAVLGRFGVGKSSFINFLEESLTSSQAEIKCRSVFVRINGWGLVRGGVSEVILRQSLSKVSEYIDVSSVSGISQSYRISKGIMRHPIVDFIASIIWGGDSIENDFYSLNDILSASRSRLFIVLEDIDRNPDSMVFQEEVPALVERVKQYKNICFILAMGSKSIHLETLVRICEYQEILG